MNLSEQYLKSISEDVRYLADLVRQKEAEDVAARKRYAEEDAALAREEAARDE